MVAALCCAIGLAGCARWRSAPPSPAGARAFTSFDGLLPDGIATLVYLPDLPRAKERFRATDLHRRLNEQAARGLWRRIDFLRPWVSVAFEQITDQVDEIAWGTYRIAGRDEWFLVARINRPARHVLARLHERTLPRVAEDLRPLELSHTLYRGRRVYEWTRREDAAARSLLSYAVIGPLIVMGSDGALVRRAIDQRPSWSSRLWPFRSRPAIRNPKSARLSSPKSEIRTLSSLFAGFEKDCDVYLWSRMEPNPPKANEPAAASGLSRLIAQAERLAASHLSAVSAGFRITPPTITSRWRLDFARPPREQSVPPRPFDFTPIAPDSARTFAAVHYLPFDHPFFTELRDLLAKAMTIEPIERLRQSLRILRLVPGLGDLPKILASLEGKIAYCSLIAGDGGRPERCILIALDNPEIAASGLRALPLLLRGTVENVEYRGRPLLKPAGEIPGAGGEFVVAVVGGALVIATRADTVYRLVDAAEDGQTLDRREIVKQLAGYRKERLLAELYSDGSVSGAPSATPAEEAAPPLFRDRRLGELAASRSYSLCLRQPRGVEIVTCSTTGLHWSSATLGLAALALRSAWLSSLIRPAVEK